MNKKSIVQVLLTHKAHQKNKTTWTVSEIQTKTQNKISQATIRNALNELQDLGLIEHDKHAKKYHYNLEA